VRADGAKACSRGRSSRWCRPVPIKEVIHAIHGILR
jgi:hypothetical protein